MVRASWVGVPARIWATIRRASGFHSLEAALALIMINCGPTALKLPYQTKPFTHPHPWQENHIFFCSCHRRGFSGVFIVGRSW